jgi:hypothetical protein
MGSRDGDRCPLACGGAGGEDVRPPPYAPDPSFGSAVAAKAASPRGLETRKEPERADWADGGGED